MAMIRVPYNNAMRLGQGVNSFTQQLCILGAVKKKTNVSVDDEDEEEEMGDDPPLGISQIVSYSSRFVDKVSDIMRDMNVSGSLAIKTAAFQGSGSGKYIDTDKFKESDLNFFVQVKVTNQEHMGADYTEFNNIKIEPTRFTEIYGDAFISGWEEGGEFNALLSLRVKDKSKITHISGALEAEVAKGLVKGEVHGSLDDAMHNSDVETTVTVNWCGGGQIKQTDAPWDIQTMLQVACNFPELVAMTPQRKYAILTKYSNLPSFYTNQDTGFSALDYENAGIYASYLLEAYTDYKSIWKELQVNCEDLQANIPDMVMVPARLDGPLMDYLQSIRTDVSNAVANATTVSVTIDAFQRELIQQAREKLGPVGSDGQGTLDNTAMQKVKDLLDQYSKASGVKSDFVPSVPHTEPYPATVLGLLSARHDCRLEMVKIVNEVDSVRDRPKIAVEPDHKVAFIPPAVFRMLIPQRLKDVKFYEGDPIAAPDQIRRFVLENRSRFGGTYQVSTPWGKIGESGSQDDKLDINPLEPSHFVLAEPPGDVFAIAVYTNDVIITAYNVFYTNGLAHRQDLRAQNKDGQWLRWSPEKEHSVRSVSIGGRTHDNRTRLDRIHIVTPDGDKEFKPPKSPPATDIMETGVTHFAPSNDWNMAGFYGVKPANGGGFTQLGVIWRRIESTNLRTTKAPSLFQDDPTPAVNPNLLSQCQKYSELSHCFRLSSCSGDLKANGTKSFATHIFDYAHRPLDILEVSIDEHFKAISVVFDNPGGTETVTVPANSTRVGVNKDADGTNTLHLQGRESVKSITILETKDSPPKLGQIKIQDADHELAVPKDPKTNLAENPKVFSRPEAVGGRTWWFAGFYGVADDQGILSLGVVWARG